MRRHYLILQTGKSVQMIRLALILTFAIVAVVVVSGHGDRYVSNVPAVTASSVPAP